MELTDGARRAAIVMLALGTDLALEICNYLDETSVRSLAQAVSRVGDVPQGERAQTLAEFVAVCRGQSAPEGEEFAQQLLHGALGQRRYAALVGAEQEEDSLDLLREMEAGHVLAALEGEAPQVMALVVSHMPPQKAAELFEALASETRGEIALRLARLGRIAPGILSEIGKRLARYAEAEDAGGERVGGVEAVVSVVENASHDTQDSLLAALAEQDAELADEVDRLLFRFEDAVRLESRALEVILRNVDAEEIARALKNADDDARDRVLSCLSTRGRAVIEQEIEFMARVSTEEVEAAQRRFVQAAKTLAQSGEINLAPAEENGETEPEE